MLKAYRADGSEVRRGDTVTDFRGDTAVFESATRAPDAGRTGKVLTGGPDGREYYMTVFDLDVREVADDTVADLAGALMRELASTDYATLNAETRATLDTLRLVISGALTD